MKLLSQNHTRGLMVFAIDNLIWIINIIVILAFTVSIEYNFLATKNLIAILYAVSSLGFLIFAQAIALISGNFDMSVTAIAAFSATIAGMLTLHWAPSISPLLIILLMPIMGGILGAINGFFIARVGVNPFLQTLSLSFILYGTTTGLTGRTLFNLPNILLIPGSYVIGGVPIAVIILLGGAFLLYIFLEKITLGREIYAVGSNREAAKSCGINAENTVIYAMAVGGILAAIGGLLNLGYMRAVPMRMSEGSLLFTFAGSILGGVSLKGGIGKVSGIVGGILLLGVLEIGLTALRVDVSWREAINGVILVMAILLNTYQMQFKRAILSWQVDKKKQALVKDKEKD
jgi:ribose/xylose/arabinose/galactoside ABC-type transport system permease subunit